MSKYRFAFAAAFCGIMISLTPSITLAQDEASLDRAYDLLLRRQFQSAENIARSYLAKNPRRYRAEFIVAAAECSMNRGQPSAMQRMAALQQAYVLTVAAENEVRDWINYCAPPRKQPESTEQGVSVTISALEGLPQLTSAAPNMPNDAPLPRMSGLVVGTSYSGDDYTERHGVSSPDDCARLCRLQAPCRSMTYAISSKTCWLKRSVPPAQAGSDFVSAIKRSKE